MKGLDHFRRALMLAAICAVIAAGLTPAFAADPVKATVALTGTPTPGATVTAKATITISDGSTLLGIQWKQTGGVPVTIGVTPGAIGDTVTVALPAKTVFKHQLIEVLEEAPIKGTLLPAHVPMPEPFEAGLQDHWTVVGIAPRSLEEAAEIAFELTVTTTSGTYKVPVAIDAALPYPHAAGLRNVPIGSPVLLSGKTQDSYNWTLNAPIGSKATLEDAKTQTPEFIPDIAGTYDLVVTDLADNKPVVVTVHAGWFQGMIGGQDAEGRPVADVACTTCHVKTGPLDMFTPWSKTGHADIFTSQVKTSDHYSENCLSCHTVGYDKSTINGGIDEAMGYQDLVASGLLTHSGPLNWDKILTGYPAVAKLANIQCENCHGPQNSAAHMKNDNSRVSLSSDVCAPCHGEPARHGRFQQWQLSKHGNYELAREEGTSAGCTKCHSSNGFLAWAANGFSNAAITVKWTEDEVHPATCVTCHDPHDMGSVSTTNTTKANSKMRIYGTTPKLDAGFTATDVGNAAQCMACHNGRRGLRNDTVTFNVADATRAPHVGPQADVVMGENLYFVTTGNRSYHAMIKDSCVTCHMQETKAPDALSKVGSGAAAYNNGTNHTFFASKDICKKCHASITAESVQGPVEAKLENLKHQIETALVTSMRNQIRLGNAIDLGGKKLVKGANEIASVEFIESHGRQGIVAHLADGTEVADLSLQSVKVVRPAGTPVELYAVTDSAVAKAGWNYFMVHSDKSHGVHNPGFVNAALDVSLFAVKQVNNAAINPPASVPAQLGGGLGNGMGAVGCTTPYVYWAEIAGHMPGNSGSQWRTDVVTRNLGTSNAAVKFILHQASGNLEGTGTVGASSQKGFEDVVAMLGGQNNLGSLEICSDQPLLVAGRIFNEAPDGTFGQNIDGHVADLGYTTGQTVSLIGLRQKSGAWRSNLSVTNAGTTEAIVAVTLFDNDGKSLTTYNLTVPAGQVVQDGEPFKNRANAPDLDWGFATLTVVKGNNIRMMGSLVDMKTNDPTTLVPKQ